MNSEHEFEEGIVPRSLSDEYFTRKAIKQMAENRALLDVVTLAAQREPPEEEDDYAWYFRNPQRYAIDDCAGVTGEEGVSATNRRLFAAYLVRHFGSTPSRFSVTPGEEDEEEYMINGYDVTLFSGTDGYQDRDDIGGCDGSTMFSVDHWEESTSPTLKSHSFDFPNRPYPSSFTDPSMSLTADDLKTDKKRWFSNTNTKDGKRSSFFPSNSTRDNSEMVLGLYSCLFSIYATPFGTHANKQRQREMLHNPASFLISTTTTTVIATISLNFRPAVVMDDYRSRFRCRPTHETTQAVSFSLKNRPKQLERTMIHSTSYSSTPEHFSDLLLPNLIDGQSPVKKVKRLLHDPEHTPAMEGVFSEYDWKTRTFSPTLQNASLFPSPHPDTASKDTRSFSDERPKCHPSQMSHVVRPSLRCAPDETVLSSFLLSSSSNTNDVDPWASSICPCSPIAQEDSFESPLQQSIRAYAEVDGEFQPPRTGSSVTAEQLCEQYLRERERHSHPPNQPHFGLDLVNGVTESSFCSDTTMRTQRARSSTWSSDVTTVGPSSLTTIAEEKEIFFDRATSKSSRSNYAIADADPVVIRRIDIHRDEISSVDRCDRITDDTSSRFSKHYAPSFMRNGNTEAASEPARGEGRDWIALHPTSMPNVPRAQDLSTVWEAANSSSTIVDGKGFLYVDGGTELSSQDSMKSRRWWTTNMKGLSKRKTRMCESAVEDKLSANDQENKDAEAPNANATEGDSVAFTSAVHCRCATFSYRIRLAAFRAEKKVLNKLKATWRTDQ
ncbi:hypothetical protein BDZ97DRAFT_2056989 [Flammula alnicola]|nr:hypothetical protein BDZ97DRAFT_2056989 [Flammula alnicola]